ncbi:MAG TPA: diguanylate cyclase [Clostridia bacterium]|nr:MAG: Cyclic di-GMP phosphodiesterase response regulator RpfG [Firmicutes bacterium ADurb.Bin146]HQM39876.1 diguanylate cyclase [Clostridia bacterium]
MKRKDTYSNRSFKKFLANIKGRALWITVVYLVIGSAWIIISDLLSKAIYKDSSDLVLVSIIKGLIYVLVTGAIIFRMIYKALSEVHQAKQETDIVNHELMKSNEEYKRLYVEYMNKQLLLKSLINTIPDHIFCKDREFRYISCNQAFAEFYGKKEQDFISKDDYEIFGKEIADKLRKSDYEVIIKQEETRTELELTDHAGRSYIKEAIITPYYDANRYCIGLIGVARDITERKKKEEEVIYLSQHDILTGLYNRLYLENIYEQIDNQENLPISIIIGDINGLKIINDSLGHMYGDKAIKDIAEILKKCCSDNTIIARTGGDEFMLVLPNTENRQAYSLIKKIEAECNIYLENKSNSFYVTISLGCATKNVIEESIIKVIQQAEENMYRQKIFEYKSQHSAILTSIKKAMFEKSCETEAHSERMAVLSKKIGEHIGLSQEEITALELLSNLHDIGKISIDEGILTKPGKLNEEEWEQIKKHPEVGYRIAQTAPDLMHISEFILSHHERWDGLGYPQGLKGKEIPLLSRIIAIVDSYDAMTQDRPYSRAKTAKEAKKEILDNAGTQFDPVLAKLFVEKVLS